MISIPQYARFDRFFGPDYLENADAYNGERVTGASRASGVVDLTLFFEDLRSLVTLAGPCVRSHFRQVVVVLSGSMEPAFYRGTEDPLLSTSVLRCPLPTEPPAQSRLA